MSWLTDIAGKAESFLNKLDSEAATVLAESKNKADSQNVSLLPEHSQESFISEHTGGSTAPHTPQHFSRSGGTGLPSSASVPGDLHDYFRSTTLPSLSSSISPFGTPAKKSTRTSHNEPPTATPKSSSTSFSSLFGKNTHSSGHPKTEDFHDTGATLTGSLFKDTTRSQATPQPPRNAGQEHLIDFTSHSSSEPTRSESPMTWTSDSSRLARTQDQQQPPLDIDSRHSRQSSLSSRSSSTAHDAGSAAYTSLTLESSSTSSVASSACSGQLDSFVKVDHPDLSTAVPGGEVEMLKREVVSLNQEIRHLVSREKNTHSEVQNLREAQNTGSGQLSAAQRRLADLQQREMDLQESLRSRERESAVLHRRIQEMEGNLASKEATLLQCQQENARLCAGASVSSGRHSEALEEAQGRLKEAEAALDRLRQQHRHEEESYTSRLRAVEAEREALREQVAEAGSKLQAEKIRQTALHSQLANARQEAADAHQELDGYKAKARHILASKEALIEALKEGRASSHGPGEQELLTSELEQARAELSLSREELSRGAEELKRVRAELAEQERRAEHEAELAATQLTEAEQRLADQRAARDLLEEERRRAKEEARLLQEEVSRQKVQQAAAQQESQTELMTLRRQLAQRSTVGAGSSAQELQQKVSALTETLLHKQSSIDALSTELQASNLHVARLQQQGQDWQQLQYRDGGGHSDDLRSRVPALLVESPFDGGVTRRVKRAYTTLDRLSVGLGVFLRRYPVARIMVLVYMLLLHAWVLLVLLTYTPEIHPAGYHHPQHGGGDGGPQPPLPPAPDS